MPVKRSGIVCPWGFMWGADVLNFANFVHQVSWSTARERRNCRTICRKVLTGLPLGVRCKREGNSVLSVRSAQERNELVHDWHLFVASFSGEERCDRQRGNSKEE